MKQLILILIYLLFISSSFSQNSTFKGKILYQNSGKKPAVGVKIMGQGANPDYSTESGQFILKYPNKIQGDAAGLAVGAKDKNNTPIELVNADEIHNSKIPSSTEEDFYIIVCKAGQLAEAKIFYYNIGQTKLKIEYDKAIQEKKRLIEKGKINTQEQLTLQLQKDSLETRYKETLKRVDELAGFIAAINKDFASKLVKDAIQKMEKDQDIDGALEILDDTKLNKNYELALSKKVSAEEEIKKVIEGYELKIKLLTSKFNYEEIIKCYEKIIAIYEKTKLNDEELIVNNFYLAIAHKDNGNYHKALELQKNLKNKIEEFPQNATSFIGIIYVSNIDMIGRSFAILGFTDSAMAYYNKALAMGEVFTYSKDSNINNFYYYFLAIAYDDICNVCIRSNLLEKAIYSGNLAIRIVENHFGKSYKLLGQLYDHTASAYRDSGNLKKAIKYQYRAVELRERELPIDKKNLAESYMNLSYLQYRDSTTREKAFQSIHKARIIYESICDTYLIEKAYNCLILYHAANDNADSEIVYCNRFLNILKLRNATGKDIYPYIKAVYYTATAKRNINAKNYKDAITFIDSAYAIDNEVTRLDEIGLCYYDLKNYPQAITYYKKVILLDTSHSISYIFSNIGKSYLKNGQLDEAFNAFRIFEKQNIDSVIKDRNWALYYSRKKEKDKAIAYLQNAVANGYNDIEFITTDESLEPIRDDDRYKKLIDKLKEKK